MPDFGFNWVEWSEIVRNLALAVAAGIGSFLAWKRIYSLNRQAEAATQQAMVARREHVMELFNRSVGQLSDERLEVRLGAIVVLRTMMEDFPELARPVYRVLSSYLIKESARSYSESEAPDDVREIMETIRIWLKRQDRD